MRLTDFEQTALKKVCDRFIHGHAKLFLFGSRTDDALKGGDIDLLILADRVSDLKQKKYQLLGAIKAEIGDQKIDLHIDSFDTSDIFILHILPSCLLLKEWS